jgi:hypothetical protein
MTDAKSTANILYQMAQLADELEAQGANIIGASFSPATGRYMTPRLNRRRGSDDA